MRRLEIHSNYLILVEEGATGAPKLIPLGSEQLEDHLSTILQQTEAYETEGYGDARKAAKGSKETGVSTVSGAVYSKHPVMCLWQPLTHLRLSNLRPTVRISPKPAASSTRNRVLQSYNQSHLL